MRDATYWDVKVELTNRISIHASHAGRDTFLNYFYISRTHFNPRVPCGTRRFDETITNYRAISIHASHAGRDVDMGQPIHPIRLFQSTRPMRDATSLIRDFWGIKKFQSTRPMRDATSRQRIILRSRHISIHASHAGRDVHQRCNFCKMRFQSTRPMRDATAICTNLSRFLRLFLCYRNTILRY